MTKYVIQSGGMVSFPERAKKNFTEVFKDLKNEPKMLWCFFASEVGTPDELFLQWFEKLGSFLPSEIAITHLVADSSTYTELAREADIIYFHGGSFDEFLRQTNCFNLMESFKEKVVCTNSASTIAFSSSSWDSDKKTYVDGLGILPIKTIVHHGSKNYSISCEGEVVDWEAVKQGLEEYGDTTLPVHVLEEGEFIVIEK